MNLEEKASCMKAADGCDEIYNLACNMGGMGFIQNNRALCMLSVLINTHLLMAAREHGIKQFFYSSSACVYPDYRQEDSAVTALKEADAYPAMPEDGYGWEKLFSERLSKLFEEDFELNVRVYRFHNVYGPNGTWDGGREKAPAAICRKIIEAKNCGKHEIEIWGDGEQTRSFMYIDDCITGIDKLMASDYKDPLNLGRSELVSINQLVDIVEDLAGIKVERKYKLDAPQGVRGRNSDNTLIKEVLGWEPEVDLRTGMAKTYEWIEKQIAARARGETVVA
jgi:nucleoside-diphosphate-sugar epimerase